MPAVQLARLKLQAAELAEHFNEPDVFVRKLSDLFEFYADRTHRPGKTGAPPPVIPAYKVPAPVLRRILFELAEQAELDPEGALKLADTFWEQPHLEYKLLAANLLGKIPPTPPEKIIERIKAWNQDNEEEALLEALADDSLARLRHETFDEFTQVVEGWLQGTEMGGQKLGLRAVLAMVMEIGFENLPVAYRLLSHRAEATHSELHPYILDILHPLIERSPQESAYFLRQILAKTKSATIVWLTRQSLNLFPSETRASLRAALKE